MKAEIKTIINERAFKPFKIHITVESIQEARGIFHLFNHENGSKVLFKDYHPSVCVYSPDFEIKLKDDISRKIRDEVGSQGFYI